MAHDQGEPPAPRGPIRTCIGCRERAAASDLLRVVAINGQVVIDRRGGLPGRGAHLHPRSECLATAIKRHAFGRSLKVTTALDLEPLTAGADRDLFTSSTAR